MIMNESINRCENSIITTWSDLFLSDKKNEMKITPRLSLSNHTQLYNITVAKPQWERKHMNAAKSWPII